MNSKTLFIAITTSCLIILATNCCSKPTGDDSITVIQKDGNTLTVCHLKYVKDTVTYNLSDFVKDFKIVRFENTDEALFKVGGTPIVTDKYVGIRQSRRPFFLFDHNGKLLCEVGGVGGGPGEYTILYDETINEKLGKIYLAPFFNSSKILEYNIDGSFVRDINVKDKLNKPKIDVNDNGDITIIHLPFDNPENKFIALHYDKENTLRQESNDVGRFLVETTNKNGDFIGYSNEIFSYRNTSNFDFMITNNDTLFQYIPNENKIYPKFTIDFGGMTEVPWHIYTEIPGFFLALLNKKGVIIVDQNKQTSSYLKIVNDFFGHINAGSFNFNKGWYYQMYEPSILMEVIEERLLKSDCSPKDRKQLEEMLNSLDENDNNIMFIAKLK